MCNRTTVATNKTFLIRSNPIRYFLKAGHTNPFNQIIILHSSNFVNRKGVKKLQNCNLLKAAARVQHKIRALLVGADLFVISGRFWGDSGVKLA